MIVLFMLVNAFIQLKFRLVSAREKSEEFLKMYGSGKKRLAWIYNIEREIIPHILTKAMVKST